MFDLGNIKAIEAMQAPDHSPQPWHVRLGGYRVNVPITETIPQWLADRWTEVMQEAVEIWADGGTVKPSMEFIDLHDDEMVEKRIAGYQHGYDKEWSRRQVGGHWHDFSDDEYQEKKRYTFADMPMAMKRAIVSQWDALHAQYMEDHPGVLYDKDFGYYWRIVDEDVAVRVKMWDGVDKGDKPDKENSENWERMGAPGGIWGYVGIQYMQQSNDLWRYVEGVEPPDLRVEGTEETWSGD